MTSPHTVPQFSTGRKPETAGATFDWQRSMLRFAGYVEGTADSLHTPICWGGDWDRDHCLSNQKFDGQVHFKPHGPAAAEAACEG